MNNVKKIFRLGLSVAFILSTVITQVFSYPVSLQLFTKSVDGVTKKIAIVGVYHISRSIQENASLCTKTEEIIHSTSRANQDPEKLRALGLVDFLFEASNIPETEALQKLYPNVPPNSFERQMAKKFLALQIQPFIFHQADNRENFRDLLDYLFNPIEFLIQPNKRPLQDSVIGYIQYLFNLKAEFFRQIELPVETQPQSMRNFERNFGEFISQDSMTHLQRFAFDPSLIDTAFKFAKFLQMDVANAGFLLEIVKSQRQNNKTILFCGNNHIFGLIEEVLPLLGYQRTFAFGNFTNQLISHVKVEIKNPITPEMYDAFVRDFMGVCTYCGKLTRSRCDGCHLRCCDKPECREKFLHQRPSPRCCPHTF